MSLNATLNTALTGLQTNQSLMRVASSNIANAGTEGYSRKVGELGSIVLNNIGSGVRVEDIVRKVDNFLIREVNAQTSEVETADVLTQFYKRLQDLFGTPQSNSSIAGMLNGFRSKLEQLAVDPSQSVHQFSTATSAQALVDELHNLSTTLQSMREEADRQINDGVDVINLQLQDLDQLNEQIVRATVMQAPVGELLDKRDQALATIAKQMDIKWYGLDNGATYVMTGSSYTLLDSQPRTLNFSSPTGVTAGTVYPGGFSAIEIKDVYPDLTTNIKSGKIKALVDLRDSILPSLQTQLDQMTAKLTEEINRAHNSAMPVTGLQAFNGQVKFDPSVLLDPLNPQSVPLQPYNDGATTSFGTLQFAIVDKSGNAVGDALRVNLDEFKTQMETYVSAATGSPFTYTLTLGDIINMLNGAYAATPPATTPVPPAPAGWPGAATWPPAPPLVMPSSGSDIAGLTNMSGASVSGAYAGGTFARMLAGSLQIGVDPASGYGLAIDDTLSHFTQAGTTRPATFNYLTGLNDFFIVPTTAVSAAASVSVRSDIVADPSKIGRGRLSSVLRIPTDPTSEEWYIGRGDGAGATAMANAFEQQITFASAGILPASSQRLTEYAASVIQANATSSSNASGAYNFQSGLLTELKSRQSQVSGVNIDEELASLVNIQNAYAASSRIVTTVNSMYDDLMRIVG